MIRPARESDLQQIRFLAQTSFRAYLAREDAKIKQPDMDPRQLQQEGRLFVYMIDAALGGYIAFHQDGMDMHVEHLAVTPRFRSRGIGRALLNYVDTLGLLRKCLRVVLHPNVVLFQNIAFYRSRGYTEIDRRLVEGHEYVYLERYLR
ncbi:GNAT family N-acetyltransferase [Algicella marina]|nr:GNAT family N-acetyltransferase [Algicella marina]